jgi:primosomal protein N'
MPNTLLTESKLNTQNTCLIISLPRGLYRLTKCDDCKFIFKCDSCDNNLTTVRSGNYNILICSECQTNYPYPNKCTKCSSTAIKSLFGGRDYLEEKLLSEEIQADVSNRLYDPTINYHQYNKVIITHSENLFIGIDYQSIEEVTKSLTELILNLKDEVELVFDQKLGSENLENITNPIDWFNRIMIKEKANREKHAFPPANNLILISASEKTHNQAISKLLATRQELLFLKENLLPELGKPSQPYEAKMLKRKGLYTMHLYLKYPKNYENLTQLNKKIIELKKQYRLTVRLNPRHIF